MSFRQGVLLGVVLLALGCGPAENPLTVVQVATGYHNSYALLADGTVRAWGQAQHGQLGNGVSVAGDYGQPALDAATPVAVAGLGGVVFIEAGHGAIGAAGSSVFAITDTGQVFWWGSDDLVPLRSAGSF